MEVNEKESTVDLEIPSLAKRSRKRSAGDVNSISVLSPASKAYGSTYNVIKKASDLECCIPGCNAQAAEWHHIKHRKRYGKGMLSGKKKSEVLVFARQIPVCKLHHNLIHSGKYDGPSLRKIGGYQD